MEKPRNRVVEKKNTSKSREKNLDENNRESLVRHFQNQDIADTIVGAEGGLKDVIEKIQRVASSDTPVLILGETGTGKEVIARALHLRSKRSNGPIFRVNCGAIPPTLVDSELFGHEKGAFTGAVSARKGWFERADRGTLFLDEVSELSFAAQVRLLRVLQYGTLEKVGGQSTVHVDVRLVAATNSDLETMAKNGEFRSDLWYRISVFPIKLPPLRDRISDIPELARHFARRAGQRFGGEPIIPTTKDIVLLSSYTWPGNIRELAAVIDRAAILGGGKTLNLEDAMQGDKEPTKHMRKPIMKDFNPREIHAPFLTLDELVIFHIERALEYTEGRIEGPHGAAAMLGINPNTLRSRMRKLKVNKNRFKREK